jgi:hypothetical protein
VNARAWLVVALAATACTTLPDLPANTCGNGVLEPNEDCDGGTHCTKDCTVPCDDNGGCTFVPSPRDASQYACGTDRICHAPGGWLQVPAASIQPYSVFGFGTVDVDGDGYTDVVGLSGSSMITRFGDATASMTRQTQVLTPNLQGAPAVLALDAAHPLTIVLPTVDGLAAFAATAKTITTFALGYGLGPVTPEAAFSLDATHEVVVLSIFQPVLQRQTLQIGAIVASDPAAGLSPGAACGMIDPTGFDPRSVEIYSTTQSANVSSAVFAFAMPSGGQSAPAAVCVVSVAFSTAGGNFTWNAVAPAVPTTPFSGPIGARLADVGGADDCPELVFRDDAAMPPQLLAYVGARDNATGACGLGNSPQLIATLDPFAFDDQLVGHVPLVPAVSIAGNPAARDALVTTSGVWAIQGNAMHQLYTSDRVLTASAFGDFDNDGQLDIVAVRDNDRNVDVLYRHSNPDVFLPGRLQTETTPQNLAVGDFDGDGVRDFAYTEQTAANQQRITVAYGTRTRDPIIAQTTFVEQLQYMSACKVPGPSDPQGLVDGLAAIEVRSDHSTLDLFRGSPQRDLVAYLDPRIGASPSALQSEFAAVIGGHFIAGDPALDFLAFEVSIQGTTLWLFAGNGVGTVEHPPGGPTPTRTRSLIVGNLDFGCLVPTQICPSHLHFATWPSPSVATLDAAIGVDQGNGKVIVIDAPVLPTSTVTFGESVLPGFTTPQNGYAVPPIMQPPFPADLDGTGPQLVIGWDTSIAVPQGGASDVVACKVDLTSPTHPLACTSLSQLVPGLPAGCTSAVRGRIALAGQDVAQPPPPTDDLVVNCAGSLYRVFHDAGGLHATCLLQLDIVVDEFQLADVNGDRVPDLVVAARGSPGLLYVFLQATSRQPAVEQCAIP